jgi:DNA modification methylase
MSTATWLTGDVFDRLTELDDQSVHSVITSPPYWRKRRYLPLDHPDAAKEIGQEPSPGEFLATLLRLTDELWRVVRDDGTIWINLGDTAAKSGGAGGDYLKGGWKEGQPRFAGSGRAAGEVPLAKSVCWIPELFGASLAYGRNLLTGDPCRQWITRPAVTWCKPDPQVGEIIDKFREATELIVWASKRQNYYFDLDSIRIPPIPEHQRKTWNQNGKKARAAAAAGKDTSGHERYTNRTVNPKGSPPLTWWKVSTGGYDGAHFATFPPELIVKPVIVSCPDKACSVCGKGRVPINERSWDLDESRPQARRAMQLAREGGLTTAHFEAIAAMGISEGGKAKILMNGSGKNSDEVKRLAAEAKVVLRGYFREFVGAPKVQTGWSDPCCDGTTWVPGTILDPFGGSGVTAMVATGNGRNCVSIDIDERNLHLARQRIGMFLQEPDEVTA